VISQADLAHHLPEEMVGHFVEAISSGSPSSMGSMGSMGS
jgi:hypothetical protein